MRKGDHNCELARWYVFVVGAPTSTLLAVALILGNCGYSGIAIQFVWGAFIVVTILTTGLCLWLS